MEKSIIKNKKDLTSVIQQIKAARVEFQTKSQELQWALEKHLPEHPKYEIGQELVAIEDCLNNFRKGEKVTITDKNAEGLLLSGLAYISTELVNKHFSIVS